MMKTFSILVVLFFSIISNAQTVISISGAIATVNFENETKLLPNEKVQFYDADLNLAGNGIVTKISPTKKKVLVQISSGKAQAGMTIESNSTVSDEPIEKKHEISRRDYSNMSEEDRTILARGEISDTQYILGGVLGTYPLGFGIGHAIQGRYSDKGWIFTVGELGSLAVLMAGFGDCVSRSWSDSSGCNGGLITLGAFGFLGFRIWEIVDVWATPLEINRRYRMLKSGRGSAMTFQPSLLPLADGGGIVGMRVTF